MEYTLKARIDAMLAFTADILIVSERSIDDHLAKLEQMLRKVSAQKLVSSLKKANLITGHQVTQVWKVEQRIQT